MNKLEQAARQALEFLESGNFVYPSKLTSALREALASRCQTTTTEQAEQSQLADASLEPVGEMIDKAGYKGAAWYLEPPATGTKLYAAPVRTKDPCHPWQDLTDDEIAQAVGSPLDEVYLADFRAVIAADREKNK